MTDPSVVGAEGYAAFWSPHRLRKWDRTVADSLRVSGAARAFLTDWGLPRGDGVAFSFDSRFDGLAPVEGAPSLRQFGLHGFNPLCLDEATGKVVEMVKGGPRVIWNSTIDKFGRCMVEFAISERDALIPPPRGYKGLLGQLADRTEARMHEIDPEAFASPLMPWPSHCQGLREEFPDPLDLDHDDDE